MQLVRPPSYVTDLEAASISSSTGPPSYNGSSEITTVDVTLPARALNVREKSASTPTTATVAGTATSSANSHATAAQNQTRVERRSCWLSCLMTLSVLIFPTWFAVYYLFLQRGGVSEHEIRTACGEFNGRFSLNGTYGWNSTFVMNVSCYDGSDVDTSADAPNVTSTARLWENGTVPGVTATLESGMSGNIVPTTFATATRESRERAVRTNEVFVVMG